MPPSATGLLLSLAMVLAGAVDPVLASGAASEWVQNHNSRVRLIAAPIAYPDGGMKLTAGIEIELDPGWKTYWRVPGDAGGVPPEFDWTKSTNVSSAKVLFPAPTRLADPLGDSIGYKHSVTFPVAVAAADAAKPLVLSVHVLYGVCAKICIPEEHDLTLTVDPGTGATDTMVVDRLTRALASVPAVGGTAKGAPRLIGLKLDRTGGKPSLLIDAQFPEGTTDPELFAEAVDNSYVPLPEPKPESVDGHTRFRIDLTKSDDLKQPAGKQLRLTLASDDAAAEVAASIP